MSDIDVYDLHPLDMRAMQEAENDTAASAEHIDYLIRLIKEVNPRTDITSVSDLCESAGIYATELSKAKVDGMIRRLKAQKRRL